MTQEEEQRIESTRMTLGEHLDELRRRLFRGVIAVIVAFAVIWSFHEQVGEIVLRPLEQVLTWLEVDRVAEKEALLAEDPSLPRTEYFTSEDPTDQELREEFRLPSRPMTTAVAEYFVFALKVSLFFAILIGSPILLWQMWSFIGAGLYKKERLLVLRYFPLSLGLFLAGVTFGYFWMVPYGLYFLAQYTPEDVNLMPTVAAYLSLLTTLTLALGAVFQLPILIYGLVRVGLVERKDFARFRAHFVVASFVISAMLTPPDPFTQFLMAVPMVVLYEIGLQAARFAEQPAVEEAPA